jgi:hypothetical protein
LLFFGLDPHSQIDHNYFKLQLLKLKQYKNRAELLDQFLDDGLNQGIAS